MIFFVISVYFTPFSYRIPETVTTPELGAAVRPILWNFRIHICGDDIYNTYYPEKGAIKSITQKF